MFERKYATTNHIAKGGIFMTGVIVGAGIALFGVVLGVSIQNLKDKQGSK